MMTRHHRSRWLRSVAVAFLLAFTFNLGAAAALAARERVGSSLPNPEIAPGSCSEAAVSWESPPPTAELVCDANGCWWKFTLAIAAATLCVAMILIPLARIKSILSAAKAAAKALKKTKKGKKGGDGPADAGEAAADVARWKGVLAGIFAGLGIGICLDAYNRAMEWLECIFGVDGDDDAVALRPTNGSWRAS